MTPQRCTCLCSCGRLFFQKQKFKWKLARKPCFCHTFFLTNKIEGNYDTRLFCFAYLPTSLASCTLSCVVLGFCPFPVILGVLNFSGVYSVLSPKAVGVLSGVWGFKRCLRVTKKMSCAYLPTVRVLLMTTTNTGDFK